MRGEWVQTEPGDIAYFPERIPRALRNPRGNPRDLVLVSQICAPQFDLYEPAGYCDRAHDKMKFDPIEKAKKDAALDNLSADNELHYSDGCRWYCCFSQDTESAVAVFTMVACLLVPKWQRIVIRYPTNAS